jgi:hypothetical protein
MASRSGGDISSFPWLAPTTARTDAPQRRNRVAADELANRAGLLYRLGFSEKAAAQRLCARVAWEYDEAAGGKRPASLDDAAVAKIVADTYARRPG